MNIALLLRQNIAGKLLNHLSVFIINILMVRYLGISISGLYFNELYLFNFIAILLSMGLDYSSVAWLSNQPALHSTIHRLLCKVVIFFSACMAFLFLFLMPLLYDKFIQSGWAYLFFLSGNLMLIFFQGVLSALKKFNLQNWLLFSTNCLFIILLLLLKWFNFINFSLLSLLYGGLFFIQGLLMLLFSQKKEKKTQAINLNAFYAHGIKVMLSSLVYFCFLKIDNLFVEKYTDSKTLGIYIQCGKIGQYFLYFSSVISSTLLPFIADKKIAVSYHDWQKIIRPYVSLILIGAIALALFGPILYTFLFGNEFFEMQPIMLILLPGYTCLGFLTLMNAIYIGNGNVERIFKGDLIGFLLVLIFDAFFVKEYGVKAAAIISSLAYILVCSYLYVGLRNQFKRLDNHI